MHIGKTNLLSTLDFIEDGRRADIYKWGEHRQSKRKGLRGKVYEFKKLFIDKTILRSFAHNLTVIVLLQMVLAALGTFMCQRLGLDFDVHMSIFVSPIVFPLAFSINADFQRRERVLEDLAQFKGALAILFFCHRDWLQASGLGKEFLRTFNHKLKGLILNIKEYLLTEKVLRRNFILSVIYEDFSDIAQLNDKMRSSELPENSPLITRLIHYHNLMCHAFERLRVIREYRSPRTIRSFTKVFIFLMPIVLSPYYVHMGLKSGNVWSPYYIAVLSSFIFGTLQGVQDVLDDPFDGISEDDINLGQLDDWTAQSLITNRTVTVGRFTVTTSVKGKEASDRDGSGSDSEVPSPKRVSVARAPPKRRPILRKMGSHRRVEHSESQHGHTLYPETASRLEDMQRHGLTGSTTILPGMKMKRANSDSLTMNSSSASLAQLFLQAQEKTDGARALELKKQVSFSGHVQGLSDDDNDESGSDQMVVNTGSEPSRHSRPSWLLDESEPLIAPDTESDTGTSSLGIPEVPPDRFPENLHDGLRRSPGTVLVSGRSSSAIHKNDAPKSLTELFQPCRTIDQTDSGQSPASINATSLPPPLGNLFTPPSRPPQETPASQTVCSPPGSRLVLPLSPLARSNDRLFPRVRISRSAPSSPEQRRCDTLSRSSAPISPSPESSDRIPPTQTTTSDPSALDKSDSAKPSSRFAVHVPRTTSLPSQAQVLPEDPQGKENPKAPRRIDQPGSRFRISPSQSADNEKVDDRPLVAPLASPERSPSTDNQISQPSRFNVSVPRKISLQCNTPKSTPPLRRDSPVDEVLRIKNENSEVYI